MFVYVVLKICFVACWKAAFIYLLTTKFIIESRKFIVCRPVFSIFIIIFVRPEVRGLSSESILGIVASIDQKLLPKKVRLPIFLFLSEFLTQKKV